MNSVVIRIEGNMDEFLDEIEASCKAGYFYVTLMCCLALPDICGAISSDDGLASGQKYKAWFDTYVAPNYEGNLDGSNCWAFRCAALHQGKSTHKNLGYSKILFLAPTDDNKFCMHNNILNDALNLDIGEFCHDIIAAVRNWMCSEKSSRAFQRNMATFLKRHKGGLASYVTGVDVFS